jgi:hypothetical protein
MVNVTFAELPDSKIRDSQQNEIRDSHNHISLTARFKTSRFARFDIRNSFVRGTICSIMNIQPIEAIPN